MSKTRILDAVRRLDTPAAKSLLDSNPALISAADPSGKNLLHVACMVHHQKLGLPPSASVRLASLLLDQGLEIDAPFGKDACTPLFFAVARGRNPALAK